jgi:protein gp37
MSKSGIAWTDWSWNTVTHCTPISEGCKNCYALITEKRLNRWGQEKYKDITKVLTHENALSEPGKLKKGTLIFTCSMSDLFHDDVPTEFILKQFEVMNKCSQHIFLVLTKRSSRIEELNNIVKWTGNIWLGVTVENKDNVYRINDLVNSNAQHKFLSIEPLIGPIPELPLSGIDWVIVAGETGKNARQMRSEWADLIFDKCQINNIPFFFKQWGEYGNDGNRVGKKKAGNVYKGKVWYQWPPEISKFKKIKTTKNNMKLIIEEYDELLKNIKKIYIPAQKNLLLNYWNIGFTISNALNGKPEYGAGTIKKLSMDLKIHSRTLYQIIDFSRFIKKSELSFELTWSHYRYICSLKDKDKIIKLIKKAITENLSAEQIQQVIKKEDPITESEGKRNVGSKKEFDEADALISKLERIPGDDVAEPIKIFPPESKAKIRNALSKAILRLKKLLTVIDKMDEESEQPLTI